MSNHLFTKYVSLPMGDFKRRLEREHDLTSAPEMKEAVRIDAQRDAVLRDPNVPDSEKIVKVRELVDNLTMFMNQIKRPRQQELTPQSAPMPSSNNYDADFNIFPANVKRKAKIFFDRVPLQFDNLGQLVVNNEPIVGSSKAELADYVASNWKTKYSSRPKGADEIIRAIKEHNVPKLILGDGMKREMTEVRPSATEESYLTPIKEMSRSVGTLRKLRAAVDSANLAAKSATDKPKANPNSLPWSKERRTQLLKTPKGKLQFDESDAGLSHFFKN